MASIKETFVRDGFNKSAANTLLEIGETTGEALYLKHMPTGTEEEIAQQIERSDWTLEITEALKEKVMNLKKVHEQQNEDRKLDDLAMIDYISFIKAFGHLNSSSRPW